MIKVYEITGKYAITSDSGQRLYDIIYPRLLRGELVQLDFTWVLVFASPFVSIAFSQLLKDIPSEKLNELIEFTYLNADGWNIIQQVMTNAKHYYTQSLKL